MVIGLRLFNECLVCAEFSRVNVEWECDGRLIFCFLFYFCRNLFGFLSFSYESNCFC